MSGQETLPQLVRAIDLLPDPVLLVRPEVPRAPGEPSVRVLYRNASARQLADLVPGSVVETAAQDVLRQRTTRAVRWQPSSGGRPPGYTVRLVPLDDDTVAVHCHPDDDLVSVLVDAYRVADRAWATLSSTLDAAPDAFVVMELPSADDREAPVVRHHNAAAESLLGLGQDADGRPLDEVCDPTWTARLAEAAGRAGIDPDSRRVHVHDPDGAWTASYDVTSVLTSGIASVGSADGAGRATARILVVVHDVTRDELVHRRLHDERSVAEYRASHDDLTGLLNRRTLRRELRRMLGSCRPSRSVGVVFVDLDGFKAVNDAHGHAAGDGVLVTVARRLLRVAGAGFLVGRYGGDEFVLVGSDLPGDWSPVALLTDLTGALCRPVWVQGSIVQVRASFGVHVARPSERPQDRDLTLVVAAADAAMYRHKATRGAAADGGLPG